MTKVSRDLANDAYCTFFVGTHEFALKSYYVQEVVQWPSETYVRIPMSEDYVSGVFYLRDLAVPVVDLGILFGFGVSHENRYVAVLNVDGSCLGLMIDRTSEVSLFKGEVLTQYVNKKPSDVLIGSIFLRDSGRTIQVVDPENLLGKIDVPHVEIAKKSNASKEQMNRNRRAIVFQIDVNLFAFDILDVYEIAGECSIQRNSSLSSVCIGTMLLRNHEIPLIDTRYWLGVGGSAEKEFKVIILRSGSSVIGLIVEKVQEILSYSENNFVERDRELAVISPILKGCLSFPDRPTIGMIDVGCLWQSSQIKSIGHVFGYQDLEFKKSKLNRESYLVFRAGFLLGLPSARIHEVMEYPSEVLPVSASPTYVLGICHLRGRIVTLIDIGYLFTSQQINRTSPLKVVMVQVETSLMGLIVETIENFLYVDEDTQREFPEILNKGNRQFFPQGIERGCYVDNGDGQPLTFSVLNLDACVERLRADCLSVHSDDLEERKG